MPVLTPKHRDVSTAATEWITTGEAARRLGVGSLNTVKRWAHEGKLRSRRLGHRLQIYAPSVDLLLQQADPDIQRLQRLERLLDEIEDLGRDLPPEAWQQLLAERPGRLPWQPSGRS